MAIQRLTVPARPGARSLRPLRLLALVALVAVAAPSVAAGPLPPGWPFATLQLGVKADLPSPRSIAPFGLRYQYLAGGAGTGRDWSTWNPNGSFVTGFMQDCARSGMTPFFTYYMIYQSRTGGSEPDAVLRNLDDAGLMRAYFENLKLFFARAGTQGGRAVLHFEPDALGYVQARARGDDATTVPAKVGSSGMAELRGLPDNVAGVAQAVRRLRDANARNVVLAYHASIWGSGVDLALNDPSAAQVTAAAGRSAAFYRSLGAAFDLGVTEFSDRDAGFHQLVDGRPNAWWTAADFDRHVAWIRAYTGRTGQRMALWQVPLGNTRMRAMSNRWHHYQDNTVQTLLDQPARTRLRQYVGAGVVAFLFGSGGDGATNAHDAARDGVTNPAPINGNTRESISAADDGGFFATVAKRYYAKGAMALPR